MARIAATDYDCCADSNCHTPFAFLKSILLVEISHRLKMVPIWNAILDLRSSHPFQTGNTMPPGQSEPVNFMDR